MSNRSCHSVPAPIANSCSPDCPPGAGAEAVGCDPGFRSTVAVGRGRDVGAAAAVGFRVAAVLSVVAGAGVAAGSPEAAVSGFVEADPDPCCSGTAGSGSLPQAAKRTAATNMARPIIIVRPVNPPNTLLPPDPLPPDPVAICFLLKSTCTGISNATAVVLKGSRSPTTRTLWPTRLAQLIRAAILGLVRKRRHLKCTALPVALTLPFTAGFSRLCNPVPTLEEINPAVN